MRTHKYGSIICFYNAESSLAPETSGQSGADHVLTNRGPKNFYASDRTWQAVIFGLGNIQAFGNVHKQKYSDAVSLETALVGLGF